MSALRWLGLGLGLAGAAIVIASRSSVEAPSTVGLACAAGALVCIAAGSIYETRYGSEQHPVSAAFVQYGLALAVTGPLALAFEGLPVTWSSDLVVSLTYLVLGNSLVAMTLLLMMFRRGEVSMVSALFFLVPPLAALIAWAVLGESLPGIAWAGMALAAVGVAIATRPTPPAPCSS